jgi:hypothetical protein
MADNSVINYPNSDFKLSAFESVFIDAGSLFIYLAKRKIAAKNRIDTGALSDLQITSVSKENNKYSLTIGYPDGSPAWDYYDYVNKGVTGIKSGNPNSPYAFKHPMGGRKKGSKKSANKKPSKMILAIMAWYTRQGVFAAKDDQKKNLSGLQRKRKSLSSTVSKANSLQSLAFLTARSIKNKGLKKINFIDDNIEIAFNEAFVTKLGLAIGEDILLKFKQDFNGNNNK